MDVYEAIKKRRSIRKYLDKPVEWEKISTVVDAGRLAPSSGNIQNWKFIVVTDKDKRKALAEAALKQAWMETAPVYIVVCAEPVTAGRFYNNRGEELYTKQNCAAAIENMLLEATELDLGTCWVGAFEEKMVKKDLGVESSIEVHAIITLGYADEEVPEPANFPLEHVTYFNGWMGKIKDVPGYMGWQAMKNPARIEKAKEVSKTAGEKAVEAGKEMGRKARDIYENIASKIKAKKEKQKIMKEYEKVYGK